MRLIAERHENDYGYKVYRNERGDEFTVKYKFMGRNIYGADYHTFDEKDALAAAKKQLNYFIEAQFCKGA